MPRWQRAHLAACAAIVGFAIVYFLADYAHLPRPIFAPGDGTWRWASRATGLAMGYYGQWGEASLAGALAGGATYLISAARKSPVRERTLALAFAWAATAFVIAAGWFTWQLLVSPA
jgi:hypothetical protein